MAWSHDRRATRPWRRPGSGEHAAAKLTLGNVAHVAFPRERDWCARTPTFTSKQAHMNEATPRQKQAAAALVAKTAQPVTFDEASRLICGLKREADSLSRLLAKIVKADRDSDAARLGRYLADAKWRVKHGDWLPLLRLLYIHPRRAQRLIKNYMRERAKVYPSRFGGRKSL